MVKSFHISYITNGDRKNNQKVFVDSLEILKGLRINFPCFDSISFAGCEIKSFEGVNYIPKRYTHLDFSYCKFKNFKCSEYINQGVISIDLSYNKINSFKGLEYMPSSVKSINLYKNKIKSLKGMKNLPGFPHSKKDASPNLTFIFSGNRISLKETIHIPNFITKVELDENGIESFEYAECLPRNLTHLSLKNNGLMSIEGFDKLPLSLKVLDLRGNGLKSSVFENIFMKRTMKILL